MNKEDNYSGVRQRVLKFRAWDGTGFIYSSGDNLTKSAFFRIAEGGNQQISQFTGLTDKNGLEIFEGDILESSWDTMLRLWLIEFKDGSFVHVNIGIDGYLGERFKASQQAYSERVVVGNRYQRPDLLKK
jgi:uncharacterized phage protein (TIGR01671 family)